MNEASEQVPGRRSPARALHERLNPAMAWDRLLPPEPGGDVERRQPLEVDAMRRLSVDELLVLDDDLPQADGATLFWIHSLPAGEGWEAWAASLDGARATPWMVTARRLRLQRPDPALLALLATGATARTERGIVTVGEPRRVEPVPRQLACICRERSLETVYRAGASGWRTIDAVKRRTGAMFGECQGRRCRARIAARLDLEPSDRRATITARPPLVPVPASVLAVFAEA
jgi:Sarcosine oxidase A3 domain